MDIFVIGMWSTHAQQNWRRRPLKAWQDVPAPWPCIRPRPCAVFGAQTYCGADAREPGALSHGVSHRSNLASSDYPALLFTNGVFGGYPFQALPKCPGTRQPSLFRLVRH